MAYMNPFVALALLSLFYSVLNQEAMMFFAALLFVMLALREIASLGEFVAQRLKKGGAFISSGARFLKVRAKSKYDHRVVSLSRLAPRGEELRELNFLLALHRLLYNSCLPLKDFRVHLQVDF